ncbi:hypothetical protein ACGGZK_05320 [Agromyces sp. MMS24-K17]|uniref:hypothetical protein n=1 Tax=Agromyces sp. MMS24-K17 TaxID=3372850 RepID=UPI003754C794
MDWTFWAGIVVIGAVWAVTQWVFSHRKHSEDVRGRSREQADAILDVERQAEQAKHWPGLGG